jgi:hypothetical protein
VLGDGPGGDCSSLTTFLKVILASSASAERIELDCMPCQVFARGFVLNPPGGTKKLARFSLPSPVSRQFGIFSQQPPEYGMVLPETRFGQGYCPAV